MNTFLLAEIPQATPWWGLLLITLLAGTLIVLAIWQTFALLAVFWRVLTRGIGASTSSARPYDRSIADYGAVGYQDGREQDQSGSGRHHPHPYASDHHQHGAAAAGGGSGEFHGRSHHDGRHGQHDGGGGHEGGGHEGGGHEVGGHDGGGGF